MVGFSKQNLDFIIISYLQCFSRYQYWNRTDRRLSVKSKTPLIDSSKRYDLRFIRENENREEKCELYEAK
uniref:Uncharacterized protein n=1 Tax=Octopus bimaculoides TaxID=37653 RepID=A0A0L8I1B2_OCTBM